jgi:hypothetical protein
MSFALGQCRSGKATRANAACRVGTMGIALAVALVVFVAAHLALVVGLARRRPWWRAVVALAAPPLAPWWGWREGMRARTIAWGAALAFYAIGVAAA